MNKSLRREIIHFNKILPSLHGPFFITISDPVPVTGLRCICWSLHLLATRLYKCSFSVKTSQCSTSQICIESSRPSVGISLGHRNKTCYLKFKSTFRIYFHLNNQINPNPTPKAMPKSLTRNKQKYISKLNTIFAACRIKFWKIGLIVQNKDFD